MIQNVVPREHLTAFARKQALPTTRKTVKKSEIDAALQEGWVVRKRNRRSISLERAKKRGALLESRVWSLFYRMGFLSLSAEGGATLTVNPDDKESPLTQIDVVAIDDEVALCVECKSFEAPRKEPRFAEKLGKLSMAKRRFSEGVAKAFPSKKKRHVAVAMFTWDLVLSDNDRKRAADEKVPVFDEQDLEYFEALVRHLGAAARYQFLAEVFATRQIAGLQIRVPALRTKVGELTCYTFSMRPDYLLKIAYVAHRAKGKAIDIDAYQRMISRSRLTQIADYISDGGVFPTNIVINIENKHHAQFDRGKQEGDQSGALFGWLTISPCFGAAWIIDGQHRLFAYSGHPRASSSFLNVLAFEGLSASKQAQLFVDINSEQRRVKRSLLVELDAQLKWDSTDEDKRIDAIISKACMAMDEALDSPLRNRVLLADVARTPTRCVSLTALAGALNKPGFFVNARRKGITEYGPLWRDDPTACLLRTVTVLKGWLSPIATATVEWWVLGAAEGGGLAMNNGVTVCLNILRSVLEHLASSSRSLALLDSDELVERLNPYAAALGGVFARLSPAERKGFRDLQGVDGQNNGTRMCQEALRKEFPKFDPEGLENWIKTREANTNDQARKLIDWIETTLQEVVLGTLKDEFAEEPDQWWFDGVPQNVRLKVQQRIEESDGKAGSREQNFDLIHYRAIIDDNWGLLGDTFGLGDANTKRSKRTEWIQEVGLMRNIVMHPSRRQFLSFEKLDRLRILKDWMEAQVAAARAGGTKSE